MIKAGYKITAGITALLLTVSVLFLTACGSSESGEPKQTETTAAVTEAGLVLNLGQMLTPVQRPR